MYHPAMEPRPVNCSSFVPLLRRMSYLILKRGFDLVFSLVLLVTCALLMAVIALVVLLFAAQIEGNLPYIFAQR